MISTTRQLKKKKKIKMIVFNHNEKGREIFPAFFNKSTLMSIETEEHNFPIATHFEINLSKFPEMFFILAIIKDYLHIKN